jgi:GntR family transcriptional regulator, vanillate catabolism transcriptional regulator
MVMTDAEIAPSQTAQAQQRLRELIVSGALMPGERLLEVPLAERLGVSRTPVRAALLRLAEEGLLDAALSGGGYRVRQFSRQDVRDAIELRGTLEGLAARMAAERGVDAALLDEARVCLDAIAQALAADGFGEPEFAVYERHNGEFHALLGRMCGSALLGRELLRASRLPFASPNGFLGVSIGQQTGQPSGHDVLCIAQDQHRQVLDAITQREGSRAEALMREHARIARRRLDALALDAPIHGSVSP